MALTRDSGKYVAKGGANAWFKIVTSSGADASGTNINGSGLDGGTWYALPLIKDSAFKDSTATTSAEDESGNQYTSDGTRSHEFSGNFLQRDIDTRNLMPNYLRNQYVAIIKEDSTVHVGGKYEYRFMGICKPVAEADNKFPGGETPFKFMPQAGTSAISITLATVASGGVSPTAGTFTGTITQPAGAAYVLFNLS